MIQMPKHQIGDKKAKQFLENERRKQRDASASEMEADPTTSGEYKDQAGAVCRSDDPFELEVAGDTRIRGASVSAATQLHLRLGSAPESDLLSPSPVTDSATLYEPVSVQKAKEELQRMAAELNRATFGKQTPSNSGGIANGTTQSSLDGASPFTQKRNSSIAQKSHSLGRQKVLVRDATGEESDTTGEETKSTTVDTQLLIQKSRSTSSLPLKSLLTSVC